MAVEAPGRMRMAFGDESLADDAIVCGPRTSQKLQASDVESLSLAAGSRTVLPVLVDMAAPEGGVVVILNGLEVFSGTLREVAPRD